MGWNTNKATHLVYLLNFLLWFSISINRTRKKLKFKIKIGLEKYYNSCSLNVKPNDFKNILVKSLKPSKLLLNVVACMGEPYTLLINELRSMMMIAWDLI